MDSFNNSYSPNILIYLTIDEKRIRLSDLLHNTARLYEDAEVLPNTQASLVISIDGKEQKQEILLNNGISYGCEEICFSYV